MSTDDQLLQLNENCLKFVHEQLDKQHEPMAIAAILTKVALQMYKTTLTEEGFNAMVNAIVESSDRITPLTETDKRVLN